MLTACRIASRSVGRTMLPETVHDPTRPDAPRQTGRRLGRDFPVDFAVVLTTLEVSVTSWFPTWEPALTTPADDIRVRKFTGLPPKVE